MTVTRSRGLALAVYLSIIALVAGGLAWVTWQAMALERAQSVRLALWRLDGRVASIRHRENSRPVDDYQPLTAPLSAIDPMGRPIPNGNVRVPTPLLTADLPEWLWLHVVVDPIFGWRSPLVLDPQQAIELRERSPTVALTNATPERAGRLQELSDQFPVEDMLRRFGMGPMPEPQVAQQVEDGAQQQSIQAQGRAYQQPAQVLLKRDFDARMGQRGATANDVKGLESNNSNILNRPVQPKGQLVWGNGKQTYTCTATKVDDMQPYWLTGADGTDRLFILRGIRANQLIAIQGLVIDWPKLRDLLQAGVSDVLPGAMLEPAAEDGAGDRMTELPVRLDPGPMALSIFPLDTPMRWGLAMAWTAAALALAVVGLSGWSLLDLSERRFRFVTAVTHELRTPLTSMKLFLDMLTTGMVKSEKDHFEYLQLLDRDADRLNRLIGNVLDYARLERQRSLMQLRAEPVAELVESVRAEWEPRCAGTGMQLVVETGPQLPGAVTTDPAMCRQVLGNLIDNACKYAHGAADKRVWLRTFSDNGDVVFEVEDKGPGVAAGEARSVFRAFCRGAKAGESAGGVGLGLALADRWARLLGGRLKLKDGHCDGACFQFVVPAS